MNLLDFNSSGVWILAASMKLVIGVQWKVMKYIKMRIALLLEDDDRVPYVFEVHAVTDQEHIEAPFQL